MIGHEKTIVGDAEIVAERDAALARAERAEKMMQTIALLARDATCDTKGRRLDECYDTITEVALNPQGAFTAISDMSDGLDKIKAFCTSEAP